MCAFLIDRVNPQAQFLKVNFLISLVWVLHNLHSSCKTSIKSISQIQQHLVCLPVTTSYNNFMVITKAK